MGYRLNRLNEPDIGTVSNPMQTEFGIHHRLESCAYLTEFWTPNSNEKFYDNCLTKNMDRIMLMFNDN